MKFPSPVYVLLSENMQSVGACLVRLKDYLLEWTFDPNETNQGVPLLCAFAKRANTKAPLKEDEVLGLLEALLSRGADPALICSDGRRAEDLCPGFMRPVLLTARGADLRMERERLLLMSFAKEEMNQYLPVRSLRANAVKTLCGAPVPVGIILKSRSWISRSPLRQDGSEGPSGGKAIVRTRLSHMKELVSWIKDSVLESDRCPALSVVYATCQNQENLGLKEGWGDLRAELFCKIGSPEASAEENNRVLKGEALCALDGRFGSMTPEIALRFALSFSNPILGMDSVWVSAMGLLSQSDPVNGFWIANPEKFQTPDTQVATPPLVWETFDALRDRRRYPAPEVGSSEWEVWKEQLLAPRGTELLVSAVVSNVTQPSPVSESWWSALQEWIRLNPSEAPRLMELEIAMEGRNLKKPVHHEIHSRLYQMALDMRLPEVERKSAVRPRM